MEANSTLKLVPFGLELRMLENPDFVFPVNYTHSICVCPVFGPHNTLLCMCVLIQFVKQGKCLYNAQKSI